MAGVEFEGKRPFENVYFTGLIRDKQGRKMSKSLGNSPDPIELIEKYSADGVRLGLLMTAPAGNDIPFDDAICEQGRNFTNKIWNSLRLVQGWEVEEKAQPEASRLAIDWLNERIKKDVVEINDYYKKYRLNDAALTVYKLVWDAYCSWYLEAIKPNYGDSIDRTTYESTIEILGRLMTILNPMMPFITEEVWHSIQERSDRDCAMLSNWPEAASFDAEMISNFELAQSIITEVRSLRASKKLSPRDGLVLMQNGAKGAYSQFESIISKLANVQLEFATQPDGPAASFIIGTTEFAVPLEGLVDSAEEKKKLEEELKYQQGFMNSVSKKLANERFVSNAPEAVVASERKKMADAESRIKSIQEAIAKLQATAC